MVMENTMDTPVLRPWLRHFTAYTPLFGVILILLFGIPRFAIVMQSYVDRTYGVVMFVFLAMWFVPFILFTKNGRREIGIKAPSHYWRLPLAFILGALSCLAVYFIFTLFYHDTISNAFVYIGGNNAVGTMDDASRSMYFWIAVIPSMLFSPIGEELFYRGVIHGSFVRLFGENKASMFDSLAFALTHIAHFGLVYTVMGWTFLLLPALLWVFSMYLVCRLFFRCKLFCGSIWGAVLAHAGFNFAMMYVIFYRVL